MTPLASHHRHFCPDHEHLTLKCAVIECEAVVAVGHRTCNNPDHRALETAYFSRGKALFQLRSRLRKVGVAVQEDSVPPGTLPREDEDDEVIIESGRNGPVVVPLDCEGKPEAGNRTLRAYFGARRTHNEQLIMRSCGVILSRATFFGSEAISAVNVRFHSSGRRSLLTLHVS
jgi:hypothetical protein